MSEETLYTAMAKAFPLIEGALKDSDNDAFKRGGKATKYADLSSVVEAIKPALSANGLFFTQMTHEQQGGVCIETLVHHSTGQSMSFGKLFVPAGKNDAHGYGSALTYARRYSLMTAFGVCPEDDDGNAANASPPRPDDVNRPQPRQVLDGPYTSKTALKKAADSFYRDLIGCGDSDMLEALLAMDDSKALVDQLKRDWPGYLTGEGMPGDFEPMYTMVKRLRHEFGGQ